MHEINRIKERLETIDKLLNNEDYYIDDDSLWEAIQEKRYLEQELDEVYIRVWERDFTNNNEYGVQLSESDDCDW